MVEPRQRTRVKTPEPTPEAPSVSETRTRVRQRTAAPVPQRAAASATTSVVIERRQEGVELPIEVNVQQFPVDIPEVHATIHVGGKVTIQPRDNMWVSISVGMWFPCVPTEVAANETYAACSEWVERKMAREREMLTV